MQEVKMIFEDVITGKGIYFQYPSHTINLKDHQKCFDISEPGRRRRRGVQHHHGSLRTAHK
jgi:hypothetical protein